VDSWIWSVRLARPREEAVPVAARAPGAGRPTKRERRSIEKLLGRPTR
jgi:ribosome-associated heat shock protein Hsp15